MELFLNAPSPWVARWSHLIAPGSEVLDVACGSGRHVHWFAARGCHVVGVDRDAEAVAPLREIADIHIADIEHGPWPFAERRFDALVVTNYLWRPLLPTLIASLRDGGVLLYETFAQGNEAFGRPRNPDFLLARGELLSATAGLHVIAFEDGFVEGPPRCVQRIVARRPVPGETPETGCRLAAETPGTAG